MHENPIREDNKPETLETAPQEPKKVPTLSMVIAETSAVVQMIIENGGELTEEMELELEKNNIVLAHKLDSYGYVWERLEAEEAYWKSKADEFARVGKSLKRVRENLKERMKFAMVAIEHDEVKGNDFRFKLQKTSGKLVVEDESLLPEEFKQETVVIEVLKDDLKTAIKAGEQVPGARVTYEPSLRKYVNRKNKN